MCSVVKVESAAEACCVCGAGDEELLSPEEHDAASPAPAPASLRAMLLHLNNNKVVPNGRFCFGCARRARDAYTFSAALSAKQAPPLSEKIRALRKRLHELTQKIDVFIVVGGAEGRGEGGGYREEDIIMVERAALAAAERADAEPAPDARGQPGFQCSVCPRSFPRLSEYRQHAGGHGAEALHWCWSCGASFPSAAARAQHSHASSQQDPCPLCRASFQSVAEQRRHWAACSGPCPACGAAPGSRAALRAHAAAHAALCAQCFLLCDSAADCAAHALLHRRHSHYVCGYRACILRFPTRSDLMAHIRKCHGGDDPAEETPATLATPAPCPHCPRTFGSAAAMKRHARTHQSKDDQDMEWSAEVELESEEKVEYLEVEALEELELDAHSPL